MRIILQQDVDNLGTAGDVVDVKDGYARNYLIPKKIAVEADTRNLRRLEHQKRLVAANRVRLKKQAEELAGKLAKASCTIPVLVGEQDKLFGSVTTKDIEEALRKEGLDIPRRNIVLEEPIKKLGVYNVDVRLHPEVTAQVKVWVVAK
ncbi:MAG: 50S ribosomal protein L9 [Deltaproteobacteria bacterium]|nr:MAG: 50S ribosomal protein L9 [Deltaproteobacteria bacterium]